MGVPLRYEPILPQTINDMAVIHHELYLSYLKAGFSEGQALVLLVALMQKKDS